MMIKIQVLLIFATVGRTTALHLNRPLGDLSVESTSNALESWNRTLLQTLGPYWGFQTPENRNLMLKQVVASDLGSKDSERLMTLILNEKIQRLRLKEKTGVEVVPGCSGPDTCSSLSYLKAVLHENKFREGKGDFPVQATQCFLSTVNWCVYMTVQDGMKDTPDLDKLFTGLAGKSFLQDYTQSWQDFVQVPSHHHMSMMGQESSLLQNSDKSMRTKLHITCTAKTLKKCEKWTGQKVDTGVADAFQAHLLKLMPAEMDNAYALLPK